MHIKSDTIDTVISWNDLLLKKRSSLNLSELDFSALSSWISDCYQCFDNIYFNLLKKIQNADSNDSEELHEYVAEIFFDLQHIKDHIDAGERGFLELMRVLADTSEK